MRPPVKIPMKDDAGHVIALDFGTLTEGLRAMHRRTPTALANIKAHASQNREDTIARIFAWAKAGETLGPCSFHSGVPAMERTRP